MTFNSSSVMFSTLTSLLLANSCEATSSFNFNWIARESLFCDFCMEEYHPESHKGITCINDHLPRLRIMKHRARYTPDQHKTECKKKRRCAAGARGHKTWEPLRERKVFTFRGVQFKWIQKKKKPKLLLLLLDNWCFPRQFLRVAHPLLFLLRAFHPKSLRCRRDLKF